MLIYLLMHKGEPSMAEFNKYEEKIEDIMAEYIPEEGANIGPEHMTKIIKRNFTGRVTEYNEKGRRQFTLMFPGDIAQALAERGWNVVIRLRDDGSEVGYLLVDATADERHPHMFVQRVPIGNGKFTKHVWPESSLSELDGAQIKNVKLRLRASFYKKGSGWAIKAYLKRMDFELEHDDFDDDYELDNMPFSPEDGLPWQE